MGTSTFPKVIHCSETAFMMVLGDTIAPQIHHKVISLFKRLERQPPKGVITVVPTYCAVMIVYDPLTTVFDRLLPQLEELMEENTQSDQSFCSRVVEIPVCYGGSHGPDLNQVARHCGFAPEEIIARHSAVTYPIYMIGFSPGFPFLGGLDPCLHTPRLATPRTRVPAGSVGIANAQTGIYPIESPGGWQIIGRTPLRLFQPDHRVPFRYQVGDQLRFIPIEQEEYHQIQAKESA